MTRAPTERQDDILRHSNESQYIISVERDREPNTGIRWKALETENNPVFIPLLGETQPLTYAMKRCCTFLPIEVVRFMTQPTAKSEERTEHYTNVSSLRSRSKLQNSLYHQRARRDYVVPITVPWISAHFKLTSSVVIAFLLNFENEYDLNPPVIGSTRPGFLCSTPY